MVIPLVALGILILFNLFRDIGFFSIGMKVNNSGNIVLTGNLISIIDSASELAIIAMGMTMVTAACGGQDISVGAVMAVAGAVCCQILSGGEVSTNTLAAPIILAALVGILVSGVCGAFNGFIIGFFDIPAMLVTLCGLQLYKGLAYGITGGPAINGMCDEFKAIANGSIAGIPYVLFIFIAVLVVVSFVMKSTVFGNEIYFLGSNAQAAKYSGINTLKVTVMTHMFSGILGGCSGILITSHLNSAKSSNGETYTLLSLLIVVLGGVHPDGGKGRVMGVVLATILLQMIANALGLMHIDDNTKTFINGCMLVAALLLDVYLDKRAQKRA